MNTRKGPPTSNGVVTHRDGIPQKGIRRQLPLILTLGALGAFGWWASSDVSAGRQGHKILGHTDNSTSRVGARAISVPADRGSKTTSALVDLLQQQFATSASEKDVLTTLQSIGLQNPVLALELAQARGPTEEEKACWVTEVMKSWAGRDAKSAWLWLQQQQPEQLDQLANGTLLRVVCDVLASRDPQRLFENLNNLPSAGQTSEGVAPLVTIHIGLESLCTNGEVDLACTAVEAWARNKFPSKTGAAVYETVARHLAEKSAEEAAAWLKSLPASEDRSAALATFAADWTLRDPTGAMSWAEKLTPYEGRTDTLERIFGDWVERSSTEAVNWLGEYLGRIPADGEADRLISTLLSTSSAINAEPRVALQWASLVDDPRSRAWAEERVLARWARRELGLAAQYVRNAKTMDLNRKRDLIQKLYHERPPLNRDE